MILHHATCMITSSFVICFHTSLLALLSAGSTTTMQASPELMEFDLGYCEINYYSILFSADDLALSSIYFARHQSSGH